MYQRLLLLLTVFFMAGMVSAQNVFNSGDPVTQPITNPGNPAVPADGVMSKWVRTRNTSRIPWDASKYKPYIFNNMAFRLRYPKNYDSTNPAKYPLILFFHGLGEADNIYENEDQLYHGAQKFGQRIDADEFNGFVLFPQSSFTWAPSYYERINAVLDTLQKYCAFDPNRLITMGLSAGGYAAVAYANYYPKRVASIVTSNPISVATLITPNAEDPDISLANYLQIPIWMACGGLDGGPNPYETIKYRDSVVVNGGNMYQTYYPTQGHESWNTQWDTYDINNKFILSAYWNAAHKAQPLVYFQNTEYCSGSPISTKMGLTAGYNAYEWQYDNGGGFITIPGAATNIYIATQAGKYRARFRTAPLANWSAWSPTPVVITTKTCSADTAFAEHFETPLINDYITFSGGPVFANSSYSKNNISCQNGIFINGTEVFSRDARGVQGGRFMLNNTTVSSSNCSYFAGDQVWRTYNPATVVPNTTYTLTFYMGNTATSPTSNPTSNLAQLVAKINNVALTAIPAQTTLVGDISWKKFSYTWNSGSANYAEIGITNNTATGSGNDFVLDEISLVKYTPDPLPGGVNGTLWAKANAITGNNGNVVKVWANSDINSNSLQQNSIGKEPLLKNNAADNINFNPVVAYSAATAATNFVPRGFSGTATHTAAHIYLVTKANSTSSNQTLLFEDQSGSSNTLGFATASSSRMTWTAGSGGNVLTTANNANETGKPILWTLSKDNINNTGNGNKQDIRKNGLLIAASSATTSYTGNNSDFILGASGSNGSFNGNIAEVIYLQDATVTAETQNKIESYLAVKYGTTLGYKASPVNYKSSDGTIIWPASTTYQADVFGIGTDSVSGLVQTISNSVNTGSGDGTGQSGKGNLVVSANTTLMDKRFLMIGHDSANLLQTFITAGSALPAATGSTRLNREWKVVNTGGAGPVTLSFDTTGIGSQAGGSIVSNYALMIDNDGDGNFNNGTISFFTATGASGKKIIFSGVTLNNNVVFTILTFRVSSTLPAVWLGFTAEAVNGNALLNWKTSDELNVDRYVVEHSFNGASFTTVGSVVANNNSGVNNYTLTDYNLAPGVHYYRIRRIDKDGKSEFSETKTVKISSSGANVQVRPNPVVGSTLSLAISVQQTSKTTVQVMSVDGKIMLQQKVNLTTGNNLVNMDISHVPAGVYLVQVLLSNEMVTKKFIRQH